MLSSLKFIFLLLSLLSFALPLSVHDFDEQEFLKLLKQGELMASVLYDRISRWNQYWHFVSDNPIISTSQPINYFSLPAPHIVEFGYDDKAVGQLLFNGFYPEKLVSTFPELPNRRFAIDGNTVMEEKNKENFLTFYFEKSKTFQLFNANKAIALLVKLGFKKTIVKEWKVEFVPRESEIEESLEFVLKLDDGRKCVIACKACQQSPAMESHIRDAIRFFSQNNLPAKLNVKPENEQDCRQARDPDLKIETYSQLLNESFNKWLSKRFFRLKIFSPVDLRAGGKRTDSVKLTSALFRSRRKGKFVFSVSENAGSGAPVKFYKVVDFKFKGSLPTLLKQQRFIVLIEPSIVDQDQKFKLGRKKFRVPLTAAAAAAAAKATTEAAAAEVEEKSKGNEKPDKSKRAAFLKKLFSTASKADSYESDALSKNEPPVKRKISFRRMVSNPFSALYSLAQEEQRRQSPSATNFDLQSQLAETEEVLSAPVTHTQLQPITTHHDAALSHAHRPLHGHHDVEVESKEKEEVVSTYKEHLKGPAPDYAQREIRGGGKNYVIKRGPFITKLDELMDAEGRAAEAREEKFTNEGKERRMLPPEQIKPTPAELENWQKWRDSLNRPEYKAEFESEYNKLKEQHKGEDLRLEVVKLVDKWIQGRDLTGRVAAPAGWSNRRIAELGLPDYMLRVLHDTLYKVSDRDSRENVPKPYYPAMEEEIKREAEREAERAEMLGKLAQRRMSMQEEEEESHKHRHRRHSI